MSDEKIKWLVEKRNILFLAMCYMVHVFLLVLFAFLGIWGMVLLNAVSIIFYTILVFIQKDFSENGIVASYFEIIFYATIATILVGRPAGFVLYIVGMISVVFYLTYHHGNWRFLYQGIGVFFVVSLVSAEPLFNQVFTEYKTMIEPYSRILYIMNLVITLITVVIISFLYAQEINRMNKEIDKINAELDYQASHDELTGLLNRREMNRYIDKCCQYPNQPILVAMMDVDDFKKLNDVYGHLAGDLVLKEISDLMKKYLSHFQVSRWGGEEFLIISRDLVKTQALEQLQAFHEAVRALDLMYDGHQLTVHMTIGAVYEKDATRISHMILEADNLLYIGKSNSKNCIVTADNLA